MKYFLDTYALIEISEGNPRYEKYLLADFVITKLNAIEIHYHLLKEFGETQAQMLLTRVLRYVVDIDQHLIETANSFRLQHRKRNLSTADCIGYMYARAHNLAFVTGDREFESMPGVIFVK